jgi:hypothetical protein
MISLLIIIAVAFCVFSVWNIITLYRLKRSSQKTDKELNDAKYYELKYKTEFFVAVFSVIVAAAGLFGYNSIKDAKEEITKDLKEKTKSIDSSIFYSEKRIRTQDSTLDIFETKLNLFINSIYNSQKQLYNQNDQLNSLTKLINDINSTNKIKQNFYLVKSLELVVKDDKVTSSYKFADMTTNIGDKLPKFSRPPFVVSIPEVIANVELHHVTADGFDATLGMYMEESNVFKFSVMIIENK